MVKCTLCAREFELRLGHHRNLQELAKWRGEKVAIVTAARKLDADDVRMPREEKAFRLNGDGESPLGPLRPHSVSDRLGQG